MSEWHFWKALAVLTAALYGSLAWIWFAQLVPEAGGLTPFDGRIWGYSFEAAEAFLAALSDTGREVYLNEIRQLDSIFPAALALVLAWPLWRLPSGAVRVLVALPMAYMVADYAENGAVAEILSNPLSPHPKEVALASMLTQAKFTLLGLSVIALALVFMRTKTT